MSAMNELKRALDRWRNDTGAHIRCRDDASENLKETINDVRNGYEDATNDCADELDAIIRKYEEPTEAMVDAGAKAIRNDSGLTTKSGLEWGEYEQGARACFKAMIEAEDQDHE